jgi:hypothetical protein
MKKLLLAGLLLGGCTGTPLSEADMARANRIAGRPGVGYGPHLLGKPLTDTVGLRTAFDSGYTKTYQGPADSLAYGLVKVAGGVSYTVQNGELVLIYFKTENLSEGNKLQGCIEQLYGPLIQHSLFDFEGRKGKVEATIERGVLGSCAVTLVEGPGAVPASPF